MVRRYITSVQPSSWAYGSSGNLRAVWRVAIFVSLWVFADVALGAIIATPLVFVSRHVDGLIAVPETIDALAVLVAVAIVLRNVEEKPWSEVAVHHAAWSGRSVLVGTFFGTVTIVATCGILLASNSLHFLPDSTSTFLSGDAAHSAALATTISTLRITLTLLPAAFFEEMFFRGYLWRVFQDSLSPLAALGITSVLFGAVHVQNPGATPLAIGNVVVAGVCLGILRALTGSLPAACAAHFMWNWVMAAVLHVSVSGLPMDTPGYRAIPGGPGWWTGGAWGPEGGVTATAVLSVAIVLAVRTTAFQNMFRQFSSNSTQRPAMGTVARS